VGHGHRLAQPTLQIAPHPLCIPHNLVAIERQIEFALVRPEFDLAGQTPVSMIRANPKANLGRRPVVFRSRQRAPRRAVGLQWTPLSIDPRSVTLPWRMACRR
jgi:hypothetical protein